MLVFSVILFYLFLSLILYVCESPAVIISINLVQEHLAIKTYTSITSVILYSNNRSSHLGMDLILSLSQVQLGHILIHALLYYTSRAPDKWTNGPPCPFHIYGLVKVKMKAHYKSNGLSGT